MRITYNAPVILTFTLVCVGVRLLGDLPTQHFFALDGQTNLGDPLDYLRLFSHIIGHGNWPHLIGNFSFILLIGPMVEEKYSSATLLLMMAMTALVTGLLNNFMFDTGLLGASGIVFMLILLGSFTNIRAGEIPLTFVLVVALYLGQEVLSIFKNDNVSQFAHILGGICGAVFGFLLGGKPSTNIT
ncbi:MAG: rhomboid family intramembrane serine protease [Bernardetiaceae bacterium]